MSQNNQECIMYGINAIGTGKKQRYSLCRVLRNGTWPVSTTVYHSEDEARAAAEQMGLEIIGCGDIWRLLALREQATEA